MLYNESFFDGEKELLEDFESDLENVWGEKNTLKQNRAKKQRLKARRRVEEILAEKEYRAKYSDPFEELEF